MWPCSPDTTHPPQIPLKSELDVFKEMRKEDSSISRDLP